MNDKQWKEKIEQAREVERAILKWYRQNKDPEASLETSKCKEYDILSSVVGNVEVKEDRLVHQTGTYAIEYEDAAGLPSGIAVTTANEFVLVDMKDVVFIATESLRFLVKESKRKRRMDMGYRTNKKKQAKGWLIKEEEIKYSPYAIVKKRWF